MVEKQYALDVITGLTERTIKRLWILIILLIVLLVGSNVAWMYYENQFADEITETYTADAGNDSQMSTLIDEHIHKEKYRTILKLRFLDGMTYERIAHVSDMSVQQVKTIVYKSQSILLKHL